MGCKTIYDYDNPSYEMINFATKQPNNYL